MKYSWKGRRDYLCQLIKGISDHFGGDDIGFLREYVKEVINEHRDNLEKAIRAFEAVKPRTRCLRISKDASGEFKDEFFDY